MHTTLFTFNALKLIILAGLLLTYSHAVKAQNPNEITITGKVIDSVSAVPVSFATIRVFKSNAGTIVTGSISGEDGSFAIPVAPGQYYAEIDFMGFQSQRTKEFTLTENQKNYALPVIRLTTSVSQLDEVVVQAEKSSMELTLDKKVFNVGQDLANAGGSATDILTNIPSVSVDPEGTVKLRGSDNVRILIDGKPSGLVSFKGGSGLQQLQASMIERVEVITNPSARYEAEGMAGIINIVLKKERTQGFNGSFELIGGYPTNFGGAANLNYRHKKLNFFINYGIAYRKQPGGGTLYQEVTDENSNITSILDQKSDFSVIGFNNNIRGGLDYYFSEKSILTGSYLYRRSDGQRITHIRYNNFTSPNDLQNTIRRKQDEDEIEPNSEYSLIYKKSFAKKGHELTAEIKFLDNWENSDQLFTERYFNPDGSADPSRDSVERSVNDEFEKHYLFQFDFTKPIGKEGKFETGIRSSFRDMVNDYIVTQRNVSGEFEAIEGLDNVFVYDENIHAVYAIYGNKINKISYQAGLRAEWTDVKTTLRKTSEVNPREYANLFPSAHFTYDMPRDNAIQLSYSRRVRRPFYNDLSPFMTYSDKRNYFSGNPDLDPEFSNVFEVGHIKYFDLGSLSSSIYYRDTHGKIDRIRTVDELGNAVTLPENLNSEKATGIEFAMGYTPYEWWKLDFNFNFFYSEIDGSNITETYKATTYSWFVRQTSRFTLPKNLNIQLRGNYEAPQNTAQGKRKALYYADFSVSKDVFNRRGTITFNILDVFNSRKTRSITEGTNFYTESDFQFRQRQFNLTINYRINQSKTKKDPLDEN
ncbi:MAG TPA: TonB-dependent receptor [Ohtaekwangia sp.]|nr:TonB-dependent receptor [Ohtaekwangia sp.]